jgi:hypothetical protein
MTIRVIVWTDGEMIETDVFDNWKDAIDWADGKGPTVEFLSQISIVGGSA